MKDLDRLKNQIATLGVLEYLATEVEKRPKGKDEKLRWIHETISELYSFNEKVINELKAQELRNYDLEVMMIDYKRIKEKNEMLIKNINQE